MLLVLLALVYIALLAFIYGAALLRLLQLLLRSDEPPRLPISVTGMIGLVGLAVVAGYLSFFIELGIGANALVLAGALALLFLMREQFSGPWPRLVDQLRTVPLAAWLIFLLAGALVIVEATAVPKDGDSGLYHIQTIKWLETYGVVPGLGNLHGSFAGSSMWYPLAALFALSFLGIEPLHVVNGVLYIFAIGYFLGGVQDALRGDVGLTAVAKLAAIPFTLFLLRPQIGSPGTDLPAALLVWTALVLILERRDRLLRADVTVAAALLLVVYAVTIKLSVVPIFVLSLLILARQMASGGARKVGLQVAAVVLLTLPWIGRHIVTSGYLIYPLEFIDLFAVDWKMPHETVLRERLAIQGWSRLPGPEWQASLEMQLSEWLPRWYEWLPNNFKLVVAATGLTMMGVVAGAASRPRRWFSRLRSAELVSLVYLTAVVGVAYWFLSAPDPRYGFVFMFLLLVIPLSRPVAWLLQRYGQPARRLLVAGLALYVANHMLLSIPNLSPSASVALLPEPYPRVELDRKVVDGQQMHLPVTTDRCWNAPLPCMPVLNEGLRLRGAGIGEGFRIAYD